MSPRCWFGHDPAVLFYPAYRGGDVHFEPRVECVKCWREVPHLTAKAVRNMEARGLGPKGSEAVKQALLRHPGEPVIL